MKNKLYAPGVNPHTTHARTINLKGKNVLQGISKRNYVELRRTIKI